MGKKIRKWLFYCSFLLFYLPLLCGLCTFLTGFGWQPGSSQVFLCQWVSWVKAHRCSGIFSLHPRPLWPGQSGCWQPSGPNKHVVQIYWEICDCFKLTVNRIGCCSNLFLLFLIWFIWKQNVKHVLYSGVCWEGCFQLWGKSDELFRNSDVHYVNSKASW